MQRLSRLITLVAVVLALLLPATFTPAQVRAQDCTSAGEGAPEGIAQRFREACDAAPDIGSPVAGEYGRVHPWNGYGPLTQTFDGPNGLTNLMYQELHDAVYRLYGDWLAKYEERGGPDVFGAPIDNPHDAGPGVEQYFEGGAAGRSGFFRRAEDEPVYVVQGAILERYVEENGTSGQLGAPISDEYGYFDGVRSDFDGGFILCCDDGSEVFLNSDPAFNTECTDSNHIGRKTFNHTVGGTVDALFSYEVYYRKTDCSAYGDPGTTYQITKVVQRQDEPSQTGLTYYWQSVSFGYYDPGNPNKEPEVDGDDLDVGCVEMKVGQSLEWLPQDWVVSMEPGNDTFESKVANKELAGVPFPKETPCWTHVGEEPAGWIELLIPLQK